MEEELDDVLILVDEEDQEHPFQMIDMVEVDGSQYAVLVPLEEGSDEDEAIILKIVLDENGEEVLYDIEDDEEWEKVVDIWNDSQEG
ncbi:MAG: DUF1292 domain-containing protein [Peptococcaceae bacterium]|nr:DUF1292 domain-containing protein [Peptococcaceae bacterium]MBO5115739.1 DUF1292 domain-containing protein [Peptococcaceae bacterium]MBO5141074.1 DUF1292 domain-containing protein [Peptococcaceae bacterium]MBO5302065.1 DUF1292 domain-containing protein [Peptococcaceae bacterium]MBO5366021.1 DUF1292 domain-containing protein [Peptococcaceae bacterium]